MVFLVWNIKTSTFIIYLSNQKYIDTKESIYTEILEAIGIHLITLLFIKSLLDFTKNISNSFFNSSSLDNNIQTYFLSAIHTIKIKCYLILWEIFPKSTDIISSVKDLKSFVNMLVWVPNYLFY